MPDESPAAEVAFDEYPNVDFTRYSGEPLMAGSILARSPPPSDWDSKRRTWKSSAPKNRPHWFLRFYRMLRKLIRRRQESELNKSIERACDRSRIAAQTEANKAKRESEQAILKVRADAAKEIASRDKALSELQQQMDRRIEDLQKTVSAREKDIKANVELEIPKLKRELQVKDAHINYLEALLEKKLSYEEAEIALHNKRVVDAETAADQLRQSAFMAERGR